MYPVASINTRRTVLYIGGYIGGLPRPEPDFDVRIRSLQSKPVKVTLVLGGSSADWTNHPPPLLLNVGP